MNATKLTQQTHSEYVALLLSNISDDALLDPEGLPDLPFSAAHDSVLFDKKLEVDKRARLQMVHDGYFVPRSVFCMYMHVLAYYLLFDISSCVSFRR